MAPKREKAPKGDRETRRETRETWPADQTERRATAALVPYAMNARTHSAEQVAQIAASITEFGFTMPVLVDEADGIIAGHGRVLAAEQLKLETVPVIVARGWDEAKKRARPPRGRRSRMRGADQLKRKRA